MTEVDIFIPCFIDQLYPETAFNMIKVLKKAGCNIHYNQEQTCCGQPAFNAGYRKPAREVAGKFLNDFSNGRYIVTPSGSCAGMVKGFYGDMFKNSSKHNQCRQVQSNIYEFSSFMVNVLKVDDTGSELNGVAAYHDSCGALRECGIKQEPRRLLGNVKGLELREIRDVETCCGFGGTFAVKFEPISVAMAEQKINNVLDTGAEYLISTDLSCLMHLEGYIKKHGIPLKTMHIADVLASGW